MEREMELSRVKRRRISKPEIFLSHSGQEKPFTEHLYRALERAHHHSFFDQNSYSLPEAEKFAPKILEAAEQCRLGVVVVSEGYLTSKWPMLELSKFVESKMTGNPELRLFPLFFKLSPSDLKKSEVETKWKPRWRELVERGEVKKESVELWSRAVSELCASKGLEFAKFANSEYKYISVVVDVINKQLPPIFEWSIDHIQGYERLCQLTSSLLNEVVVTKDNIVHYYLGLYGMGGVGKTTLCKAMCSFMQIEFRHKVCHVELKGDKVAERRERLKVVCQQLTGFKGSFQNEEQGWKCLEEGLRNQLPMFLAIDNVGDSEDSREEAQNYLKGLPSGSKVIVTARSQEIVKIVLSHAEYCKPMPRLEHEEAAMLFLSKATDSNKQSLSCLNVEEENIVERCLNECQFADNGYPSKQYHPLVLRALGTYFHDVDSGMDVKKWEESLEDKNKLQRSREGKKVNEILGLNYHSLCDEVKLVFLDLVLYDIKDLQWVRPYWWLPWDIHDFEIWILWISQVHGVSLSQARMMMKQLQRQSLLEESSSEVLIHDLYKEFASVLVETKKSKEWEWWMSHVSNVADLQRHVSLNGRTWIGNPCTNFIEWRLCHNLVFLHLSDCKDIGPELDLGGLSNLRVLFILGFFSVKRIVCRCHSGEDDRICRHENDGCLSELVSVTVDLSDELEDLPFLRHCWNIQHLNISVGKIGANLETYLRIGIDCNSRERGDLRYLKALSTLRISSGHALLGHGSVDLFIRWLVSVLQLKNLTALEFESFEESLDDGGYTIDLNQVDQLSLRLSVLFLTLPRQIEEIRGLHLFSELTTLQLKMSRGLRRLPDLEKLSKLKWICLDQCCKLERSPCFERELEARHHYNDWCSCLQPHCDHCDDCFDREWQEWALLHPGLSEEELCDLYFSET